jgi:hypothetical protein
MMRMYVFKIVRDNEMLLSLVLLGVISGLDTSSI